MRPAALSRAFTASPCRERWRASAPGEIADRLLGLAADPDQERSEEKPEHGGGEEKEVQQYRVPQPGVHMPGHGRLDQREALGEQPEGDLAERREAHEAVGDRARAVDDEPDEPGRDQDQAEKAGKEAEHQFVRARRREGLRPKGMRQATQGQTKLLAPARSLADLPA